MGRTVLVTEAYSASNLGDLELVQRSVSIARRLYPTLEPVCVAVDPKSFDGLLDVNAVRPRLFPRLDYINASQRGRASLLTRWATRIITLSVLSFLPQSTHRKAVQALAKRGLLTSTVHEYLNAEYAIAVGGGYLGDQYMKESLLTFWTWWWSSRLGCSVETMPLSVEMNRWWLRVAAAFLTRKVRWRARDESSRLALAKAKLQSELLPDLAFLNFSEVNRSVERKGTVVALVGSDYLSEEEGLRLVRNISAADEASLFPHPIKLLSMHGRMSSTSVGGDLEAAVSLEGQLSLHETRSEMTPAGDYFKVCEICSHAEVVVSARMHAGIAALCAGARVGLLAYEEKHFALMRDLGLHNFVIDIRSPQIEVARLAQRLREAPQGIFIAAAERYYDKLADAFKP